MSLIRILSTGEFVSGEEIARSLKLSRAAVHKRIGKLRAEGYLIEGGTNRGYRLLKRPDILSAEELSTHLAKRGLSSYRVLHFPEIASTQDVAKEQAYRGEAERLLVTAERQTGGRGRLGREWSSPEGGLWFSLVLRPSCAPERVPQITLMASLALCRALEAVGLTAQVKWPNDVFVGGRKIAGILTEMSAEPDRVHWVVLGVGLNVNNDIPAPLAQSATSVRLSTGAAADRPALLADILAGFETLYGRFLTSGFAPLAEEYRRRSLLIGRKVRVAGTGETLEGVAQAVDDDGALVVQTAAGAIRVLAGDVTLSPRRTPPAFPR